jgi:hypothetical protein
VIRRRGLEVKRRGDLAGQGLICPTDVFAHPHFKSWRASSFDIPGHLLLKSRTEPLSFFGVLRTFSPLCPLLPLLPSLSSLRILRHRPARHARDNPTQKNGQPKAHSQGTNLFRISPCRFRLSDLSFSCRSSPSSLNRPLRASASNWPMSQTFTSGRCIWRALKDHHTRYTNVSVPYLLVFRDGALLICPSSMRHTLCPFVPSRMNTASDTCVQQNRAEFSS